MTNKIAVGLFLCLACLQVASPLSMIVKREIVLKSGGQFKFKTAPVDPYDAFRGRYVALRLEGSSVAVPENIKFKNGQTVYVLINTDEEYAKLTGVVTNRPVGKPYMQAGLQYIANGKAYLNLPIDRYYMEEKSAPLAENIYRQANQANKQEAYVLVRIKDGFVVIEGLYVGGQKIEDAVRQLVNTKKN